MPLTDSIHCSGVSVVDFEQVSNGWEGTQIYFQFKMYQQAGDYLKNNRVHEECFWSIAA